MSVIVLLLRSQAGLNNGAKITQVTYTWKLDGVPGWVDKNAFSGVKGMAEPEEAKIVLVKTNNGWKAN